jgi:DNA-binding CsgD family transcriptional regulator
MTAPPERALTCPILISRTRELAALHSLIDSARSGQGHVALISGEAGIGKSRLVAEAKTQACAQGFLLLQGNCFQADTSYPYAPLLDLLRAFFAGRPPLSLAAEQEPLLHELAGLLPDLALLFPPPFPSPLPHPLEPTEQKRRLLSVLTQFFVSQAAQHPVLVIVEDLHWCDESSLDFLLGLARHSRSQPLLCLYTYRSDELSPGLRRWLAQLDRERLAQELSLAPLSRTDVDAMLQVIFAPPRPLPAELLDPIYTLSEGNPFFVEELLTSLTSTGELLYAEGTGPRKAASGEARRLSHLPRSIQDAMHQRTERLSAQASHVVILAAVAGRRFDFALLQQVLQCDEAHLLALMKELIAAQLVVEEAEDWFAFRHALIREAVYAELLARERRSLHRTIAEALEALSASRPVREASLTSLAFHFSEAGIWPKALEYEQRAGEKALSLYAPRAASDHFTRALDAAQHLHLTPPAQLYYARGQAEASLGDFERARGDYERAGASARNAHDGVMEWQSMIALGFLWAARDYAQAGAWFRRASTLAEQLADPTLRARSLNRLGNWLANTGRTEEGLRAHQEALHLFEGMQDTQGMAETFDLLGTASGMVGDQVNAVQQFGQAIALFRTLGDRQSLMSSLVMRASLSLPLASITSFCALRTRDECVQDAAESLHLARQIDSPSGQALAENILARTLLSFGEFGPAFTHAWEALRIATAIEHHQWLVASSSLSGYIYFLLLAPAQARAAWETGLSLARELGSTYWITALAAQLALACLLQHDVSAAEAALQAVLPREQLPRNDAERHVAWAWGELALAQGAPEMALQVAEHLLASAPGRGAGQPVQPIPHLLKLNGEALMALARLEEAMEALEGAKRGALLRHDRPVLWTIHRSLGQLYHLLQRKEEERIELAAARHLIEELGATLDDVPLREQFVRTALNSLPQAKPLLPREATKRAFGGLTARECQVAALIAQGKTSREIAERLVVSERTAEVHVSNILGKLGFSSRAHIAAWAVEKGLTWE